MSHSSVLNSEFLLSKQTSVKARKPKTNMVAESKKELHARNDVLRQHRSSLA